MAIASDSIRRARPLLGTFVEIEIAGAPRSDMDGAIDAAFDAIAQVHRLMSFHEPDSDVSRLNRQSGLHPLAVHAWTFEVLDTAIALHRRSSGLFDVTIAPALQTLGLLPRLKDRAFSSEVDTSSRQENASKQESRAPFRVHRNGKGSRPVPAPMAAFADAIELLPDRKVRFRSTDVMIDLGGIAKGFAVDRAVAALRDLGIPSGMVCRIDVADEALASTARRVDLFDSREVGVSAVIDPATQRPASRLDGVTIHAPSCMIADALTKVVMISGTDAGQLLESYRAGALLVSADGDVQITSDWNHRVHLAA
jgi:FAD:protein FMN transferase